jgi:hypothetical protein
MLCGVLVTAWVLVVASGLTGVMRSWCASVSLEEAVADGEIRIDGAEVWDVEAWSEMFMGWVTV